jgi:exopolysaccharide biosynthesis protein
MFAKTPSIDPLRDSTGALHSTKIQDKETSRNGLTLAWVIIPSHHYLLTVKDVQQEGDASNIFGGIECAGSPVIVNGGFYGYADSSNRRIPMGLVVASGKNVSSLWRWKTGGAVLDGLKEKIVPVARLKGAGHPQNALQSMPMLVWNNKNGIWQEGGPAVNRVAVGVTRDNDWIVIGAFGSEGLGVTLKEFADLILALPRLGGAFVVSALNMDGGPSAHMYVPKMKKNFGDPGYTFLPNVVCFRSRR